MDEVTQATYGTLARARRGGLRGSLNPGCIAFNEDVNSWILTLGLGSVRLDEGQEGRHPLVDSGEHTRHPRRSTVERKGHKTDPSVTPFPATNEQQSVLGARPTAAVLHLLTVGCESKNVIKVY